MNTINLREVNLDQTLDLIQATVAPNTLKAYQYALDKLEVWLEERPLNDSLLSQYISHLHQEGKSPATIALVVAAVKWIAKHQGSDGVVGETTNLLADS